MSPEQGRPAAAPDEAGLRDLTTRFARPGRIEAIYIRPERRGETVDPQVMIATLRGKIADWWLPGEVATITAMP
ncbi:MAG: hypothetical protein IE917_11135, partial [Betaproteobacteria bacterium]|nr:hypothetical protein [Betaproteobacteria bacterium]